MKTSDVLEMDVSYFDRILHAHGIQINYHQMNAMFYNHISLKVLNAILLSSCSCKLILDLHCMPWND